MSGGQSYVGVANMNESMRAEGKGSMTLETCEPKEVLHIPELQANLLSANVITENGGQVLFSKNKSNNETKQQGSFRGRKDKEWPIRAALEDWLSNESTTDRKQNQQGNATAQKNGTSAQRRIEKSVKIVNGNGCYKQRNRRNE